MKILYIVNHFKYHGGIERMLSNKIDAWIEEYGYDVVVVTINQNNAPIVYPPKNDFKLVDLKIQRKKKRYSVYELFTLISKVNKILRKESPDIVITTLTGIPSLLLPFILPKINKVLEIHSSGALSVTKSWKYKWWFLNKYHKIVLLNEDEKQYYQLNNLIVIPNFIQIDSGDNIVYRYRQKKIIAAGRIHPDKQYDHLLQIWNLVYQKFPDWKLEIYGDGDKSIITRLEDYIHSNKLNRVSIYPATNNLNEVMRRSSIFCLTSKTESFGMVILECKKNMLPVISYDSPNGPRHIISNDGVLVEQNNMEEFAEALEKMITEEDYRNQMAENAKINLNEFSSSKIIKMWKELI
ncbi:glycosyltransferase [Chryseobacterium sp. HSC-36S06]|uniref:glycosyltransferase n=1 Tax=Chryseobacterium sp. HSC-36S06 TaxID=2910970 RepID=UPI00209E7200|nr:glycosyltransferase [Chryseobacterium sp. HSC-36S06]MCP2037676.1 glycosyltransferase involved in cell wall biosynthesis [Chryseobacterium sp. HSC-36S06]